MRVFRGRKNVVNEADTQPGSIQFSILLTGLSQARHILANWDGNSVGFYRTPNLIIHLFFRGERVPLESQPNLSANAGTFQSCALTHEGGRGRVSILNCADAILTWRNQHISHHFLRGRAVDGNQEPAKTSEGGPRM